MADASKEGGNSFEEWKEVRGIFTRFDGYLNDLRKYGFSVIAALLTATSIEAMLNLDESARFALLILSCAFITALHLFDHNYRQYEKAASKRAKILEPMLNIKISEIISERYHNQSIFLYIPLIYIIFIWITWGLGRAILPTTHYVFWLTLAAVLSTVFIIVITKSLSVNLKHPNSSFEEDWSIDKLFCNVGEPVKITLTNLGTVPITFDKGKNVFYIRDKKKETISCIDAEFKIEINHNNNYSWLWIPSEKDFFDDDKEIKFKLFTIHPRDSDIPLRQSIVVCKIPPAKPDATKDGWFYEIL
jgi:hypothetical protein